MGSLEEVLELMAKVKLLSLLRALSELHTTKSELEISRAWYSVCKGYFLVTAPDEDGDDKTEEDQLKLIGFVENSDGTYKFQFETPLGNTIESGGLLHRDYRLVGGQDIDVFEMSEQVYKTLSGEAYKESEEDSPISHLLS